MKKVMINVDFIDAETGKRRKAGSKVQMTEARVEAIRNSELVLEVRMALVMRFS